MFTRSFIFFASHSSSLALPATLFLLLPTLPLLITYSVESSITLSGLSLSLFHSFLPSLARLASFTPV